VNATKETFCCFPYNFYVAAGLKALVEKRIALTTEDTEEKFMVLVPG